MGLVLIVLTGLVWGGIGVVLGMAAMFFFAAVVEGFWSASRLPPMIKYAVGTAGWILVLGYFFGVGRGEQIDAD